MTKTAWIGILTLGALLGVATPVFAFSGGDNSDHDGPLEDELQVDTIPIGSSFNQNATSTQISYQAVDSFGFQYTVFIDAATGEISASTADGVISNVLSASQKSIVESKYQGAGRPMVAGSILLPVVVGALLCYTNDQLTKFRQRAHCSSQGQTVVMESSGVCGQMARYRCEFNKPPRPLPNPFPIPPPNSTNYWTLPGSTNVGQHVINISDKDWLGN